MSIQILSQEYLRSLFDYDPKSGVMTWRSRPRDHFETLNAFATWNTRFAGKESGNINKVHRYRRVKIDSVTYREHRLIWCLVTGEWPCQIDHKDHDRSNNRIENLRAVNHQENQKNKSLYSSNKSGVAGVYWYKDKKKWRGEITVEGKCKYLGYFEDRFEVICARKSAEIEHGYHKNHGQKSGEIK